jgi:heat-inducible transcriptional repressor
MAELEKMGYIEKPHTSSGRVPSAKGYRYYIEHLRSKDDKSNLIKDRLNKFIDENGKVMHTDQIIDECCAIISQMTNLVSIVMGPDGSQESIAKIELIQLNSSTAIVIFVTNSGYIEHKTINIPSETRMEEIQDCIKIINKRINGIKLSEMNSVLEGVQLVLSEHIKNYEIVYNAFANTFLKFAKERISYYGKNNLLSQKDFMDIEKIKKVASLLENNNIWKSFDNNEEGINVSIGKENNIEDLEEVSVVSTKLKVNKNNMGSICVVGPTRMDYNQVIEALEFLGNKLEELEGQKEES